MAWNPITTGFHPNPSCIFVSELDDTWFCTSSSFLAFPGLPIHASRDSVHWKHVSNAFSRSEQLPGMAFLPPKATSDIYAPTLRFREEIFYLVTTLVNQQLLHINNSRWDNFFVIIGDPDSSETWSDPIYSPFPGFDPSLFWDDDGTTVSAGSRRRNPREPHSDHGALGHADLLQDANGRWWAVAPTTRLRISQISPWAARREVSGKVSGWPLPAEEIPEQGEGQLSDADDSVIFPRGSQLPIRFVHWRLPTARNYAVSPPSHWNTLALKSSVLTLTVAYPLPEGWAGQKPTLQIETVNSTHFAFSAGPAGKEAEIRIFDHCRRDELVPYYSGLVLGVYTTSNGKHGERAF
ncbi:glycosyl hydrolase [Daldinia vernicosa]|uniref:glycosyl hydrolase n=1 Tax=Daldinia vernicosa TaxID=114800 RepID=UPI002008DD94|nr:glycosyl hydrolase [Daldinia vernicosa]KAI0844106.1 glycosyl hydrolase [Daldinia vernicosa]